ncbi:hypothetical protein AB0M47_05610 [Hamadaea sp. NPDC051192]|uniref:hypothetical protein n=1 Tax=Hamadaea sp. NPDC051192 TaxID=3154940 RepID=UPI00341F4744
MPGQRARTRPAVRRKRAWIGVLATIVAEILGNAGGIAITVLTSDKLDPVPLVLAVTGVSTLVGLLVTVLPKDEPEPLPVAYPGRPAPPVKRFRYVSVAWVVVVMLLVGVGGVGLTYAVQRGFPVVCESVLTNVCGRNDPITVAAAGPAPWSVEGYGVHFEVLSTRRTSSTWMGQTKPSITVTAYVTRTTKSNPGLMSYTIKDQASSEVLTDVPFGGTTGDSGLPYGQRIKLVFVVWDAPVKATRLTFILHGFFWRDGRNLVLSDIRVPSSSAP